MIGGGHLKYSPCQFSFVIEKVFTPHPRSFFARRIYEDYYNRLCSQPTFIPAPKIRRRPERHAVTDRNRGSWVAYRPESRPPSVDSVCVDRGRRGTVNTSRDAIPTSCRRDSRISIGEVPGCFDPAPPLARMLPTLAPGSRGSDAGAPFLRYKDCHPRVTSSQLVKWRQPRWRWIAGKRKPSGMARLCRHGGKFGPITRGCHSNPRHFNYLSSTFLREQPLPPPSPPP